MKTKAKKQPQAPRARKKTAAKPIQRIDPDAVIAAASPLCSPRPTAIQRIAPGAAINAVALAGWERKKSPIPVESTEAMRRVLADPDAFRDGGRWLDKQHGPVTWLERQSLYGEQAGGTDDKPLSLRLGPWEDNRVNCALEAESDILRECGSPPLAIRRELAQAILILAWLQCDPEADTRGFNLTAFERWPWTFPNAPAEITRRCQESAHVGTREFWASPACPRSPDWPAAVARALEVLPASPAKDSGDREPRRNSADDWTDWSKAEMSPYLTKTAMARALMGIPGARPRDIDWKDGWFKMQGRRVARALSKMDKHQYERVMSAASAKRAQPQAKKANTTILSRSANSR